MEGSRRRECSEGPLELSDQHLHSGEFFASHLTCRDNYSQATTFILRELTPLWPPLMGAHGFPVSRLRLQGHLNGHSGWGWVC